MLVLYRISDYSSWCYFIWIPDNSSCYFITMDSISYPWYLNRISNFLDFLKFFDVSFIFNGYRISSWYLKRKIVNECKKILWCHSFRAFLDLNASGRETVIHSFLFHDKGFGHILNECLENFCIFICDQDLWNAMLSHYWLVEISVRAINHIWRRHKVLQRIFPQHFK